MATNLKKYFFTSLQFVKTALKRSLALLISIIILCVLFSSAAHMVNLKKVSAVLLSINTNWLCLLLLLMIFTFLVNSYRFAVIAKWILGRSIPNHTAIKITWLSCFLALSTPFAAVGDIARAGLVKWLLRAPLKNSFQVVLFDRGYSLLCLMVFALLSSFACYPYLADRSLFLAEVVMPASSLTILAFLLALQHRIPWPDNRFCHFLKETLNKLSSSLKHPVYVSKQIIIALMNIILYVLTMLVLAHATHFSFNLINLILFSPLILIINNLPFFYFGLGGREAIFLMLMPIIAPQATSNAVLATSLGYGVLVILVSLLGGLYLIGIHNKNTLILRETDLPENIQGGIG